MRRKIVLTGVSEYIIPLKWMAILWTLVECVLVSMNIETWFSILSHAEFKHAYHMFIYMHRFHFKFEIISLIRCINNRANWQNSCMLWWDLSVVRRSFFNVFVWDYGVPQRSLIMQSFHNSYKSQIAVCDTRMCSTTKHISHVSY